MTWPSSYINNICNSVKTFIKVCNKWAKLLIPHELLVVAARDIVEFINNTFVRVTRYTFQQITIFFRVI